MKIHMVMVSKKGTFYFWSVKRACFMVVSEKIPLYDGLKMKNEYVFIVVNEKSTFFYSGHWKGCQKINYWSVKKVFFIRSVI